ncbi:MAG: hypothetical protein JNL73_11425 [Anaerolineales bacterium]|nr:hypothetical protein [Anaerolineales bacterium]
MAALPERVRGHIAPSWRDFRSQHRSWLCQLYFGDPAIHYEIWNMGERRGKLELGLHFESRDHARNQHWLQIVSAAMVGVKATLGEAWECEPWDRGWTKVYTTVPYEPFTTDYLDRNARDLARAIETLQPIIAAGSPRS